MSQIIELDTSLIDAKINNRDFETSENMRHVASVAESIKAIGQKQPVIVKALANGRYQVIAGETRTRACASLGIPVLAIVEQGTSEEDDHTLMLVENDGRKNTNDIEKARGYQYHCDTFGLTPAELAKKLGKRVDFVESRLSLLRLRDDIQKLVQDGQLSIGYAVLMVGLDVNRQLIAMRQLRDNPSPTVKWFALVCGELLSQQQQQGLFGWGYGDVPEDSGKASAVKMPPDPANYRPSFNPSAMRQSILAELEKWQTAGEGWREYGKANKAESCTAIVATLSAILAALPETVTAVESGAAGKVLGLLRRAGESVTQGWLIQYSNMTAGELEPVLNGLKERGEIAAVKSGRGQRWAIVA